MGNLIILIEARVESLPGQAREFIIARPGVPSQWRAVLPVLLDQRPATSILVEYVVRLFQRQRPSLAATVGLLGLTVLVRMTLARANRPDEAAEDWEWAQEVA
ncbi:hypothetical protein ACFST9_01890 [Hymenobacter monticola]|uniref:Uncharacterized protein n=1 Tax=Hymenobacter monticola TaxID=1705399 RepID=A0ABY4B4Q7_9BACT|nr:hypothetical protein [Hymenobacter monticola]UOE33287.1 hypothetical protein MTP16_19445 [Hymenobacter monticola]